MRLPRVMLPISVVFALAMPAPAVAAPSGGLLVAPPETAWQSSCAVAPAYDDWHELTAESGACTWMRSIPVPASVRATLTNARAQVWTEWGGSRWSLSIEGRGSGPVPEDLDGQPGLDRGYRYGTPLSRAEIDDYGMWTPEGSLALHVDAAAAPGSTSSMKVQTNFAGLDVQFEDTTPPEILRIEGLPERLEPGASRTREVTFAVRDDGPLTFDQTGARYRGWGVQVAGYGVTPVFTQGAFRWYAGYELVETATITLPPGSGTKTVTFTAVDAVGNVATRSAQVTVPLAPPRPFRPSVVGTMRVGTIARCSPSAIRVIGAPAAAGRTTFRWRRNGVLIARATRPTLRISAALRRARLSCTITVTNAAGSGSATSLARPVQPPRPS